MIAGTNLGAWDFMQLPDIDGDSAPDGNDTNAANGNDAMLGRYDLDSRATRVGPRTGG